MFQARGEDQSRRRKNNGADRELGDGDERERHEGCVGTSQGSVLARTNAHTPSGPGWLEPESQCRSHVCRTIF